MSGEEEREHATAAARKAAIDTAKIALCGSILTLGIIRQAGYESLRKRRRGQMRETETPERATGGGAAGVHPGVCSQPAGKGHRRYLDLNMTRVASYSGVPEKVPG